MARTHTKQNGLRRLIPYMAAVLGGGVLAWLGVTVGWLLVPTGRPAAAPDPLATPPSQYAWSTLPAPNFPIPPYARFLKDVVIVLDPGHGGRAEREDWKRGPTGLREAQVNLRVAQFLRDFLHAAGANVTLTRESDVYLDAADTADLNMRVELANRLRADVFLSIHHNAAASADANYTALFYHDSPDHSPASLCVARHLLAGLNDALRLESHVECALLSDRLVFPETGFRVLREARVPAVLSEASFHSNPQEERRLRDPVYNRREAYGLFLGLARWAQAGLPRVRLVEPANGERGQLVRIELDDGLSGRGGWAGASLKILADSLVVKLAGRRLPFKADLARRRVEVELPAATARSARLYVDFENVFGQRVLHPWVALNTGR